MSAMRALAHAVAVAFVVLAACAGCSAGPDETPYQLLVLPSSQRGQDAPVPVAYVTVAATATLRHEGLGGRRGLLPDTGMLFVYRAARVREFWMKDCLISLDIAFLRSDGVIDTLVTLPPGAGLPFADIPRGKSEGPILYVLEMEAHWMARHGIGVGDLVDVSQAIEGVEPE